MARMADLAGEAAQALLDDAVERLDHGSVTHLHTRGERVARGCGHAGRSRSRPLVIARDSRHPGPHSIGHASRFVVDHAPCDVWWSGPAADPTGRHRSRSRSPSRSQAEAETETGTAMTLPPSPRGPHLLQTAGWVTRPGPYSRRLRARFGDTFTLHVDRRAPWVVLSHPDDVRKVFTGDPDVFHAGEGNAILKPLLGARSVLLLDGAGAHARAQDDAAAVPRRAHAGLRRADPRDRRAEVAVAGERADRRAPADAGADARDHHARRLRHPRRAARAAHSCSTCSTGRPARAPLMLIVLAAPELNERAIAPHARADRRAATPRSPNAARRRRPRRARGHPLDAAR